MSSMTQNILPQDGTTCGGGHFPCWTDPSPFAYSWTPAPGSVFHQLFGGGMTNDVINAAASMIMGNNALYMHISILMTSYFSDPSWLLKPVASAIGKVLSKGYDNIFVRFIPVLLFVTICYVVYQYIRGHHAKAITGFFSTILSSALIAFFFFYFGPAFAWLDTAGNFVTTSIPAGIAKAAGTNVNVVYDGVWNAYILYPWEYGQFGQVSTNIADFNVSPTLANTHPVYKNDAGKDVPMTTADNWVSLFLQNSSPASRASLVKILDGDVQPVMAGQIANTNPKNVNPYTNIITTFVESVLILPPIVFMCMLGFQLFTRELLFLRNILMGIVTVPMSFIPEIGWRVTLNWVREGLGHLVERLATVVYGAITFALSALVMTSATSAFGVFGMYGGIIVNTILFLATILYRRKIYQNYVHPIADKVRYGKDKDSGETTQESQRNNSSKQGGSPREEENSQKGHKHSLGGLAERFTSTSSPAASANRLSKSPSTSGKNKRIVKIAETAALAVATDGASLAVEGAALEAGTAAGAGAAESAVASESATIQPLNVNATRSPATNSRTNSRQNPPRVSQMPVDRHRIQLRNTGAQSELPQGPLNHEAVPNRHNRNQNNMPSSPPRDRATGRYVSRHSGRREEHSLWSRIMEQSRNSFAEHIRESLHPTAKNRSTWQTRAMRRETAARKIEDQMYEIAMEKLFGGSQDSSRRKNKHSRDQREKRGQSPDQTRKWTRSAPNTSSDPVPVQVRNRMESVNDREPDSIEQENQTETDPNNQD